MKYPENKIIAAINIVHQILELEEFKLDVLEVPVNEDGTITELQFFIKDLQNNGKYIGEDDEYGFNNLASVIDKLDIYHKDYFYDSLELRRNNGELIPPNDWDKLIVDFLESDYCTDLLFSIDTSLYLKYKELAKDNNCLTCLLSPTLLKPDDNFNIFIDMDGTIAEWNAAKTFEDLYLQGTFQNLHPNEDILNKLKAAIKEHPNVQFYILSCYLTDSKYALKEKQAWLDKYFPEIKTENRLFVPYGEDKSTFLAQRQIHINKKCVLIDDYTSNLLEWEKAGGLGVKYLNGINHSNKTWKGLFI